MREGCDASAAAGNIAPATAAAHPRTSLRVCTVASLVDRDIDWTGAEARLPEASTDLRCLLRRTGLRRYVAASRDTSGGSLVWAVTGSGFAPTSALGSRRSIESFRSCKGRSHEEDASARDACSPRGARRRGS